MTYIIKIQVTPSCNVTLTAMIFKKSNRNSQKYLNHLQCIQINLYVHI